MKHYAHLGLVLAAALWGFGNIAQKTVLEHMEPMTATCLRCAIAAFAILPFLWLERRARHDRSWWMSTIGVAALFAIAISIQQTAYLSASVTNASFLVNTATIVTPLLAWFLLREPTGDIGIAAAIVTMVGVFLMSIGAGGFVAFNWGDAACLVSAVFYALWMVALGRHAREFGSPLTCAFIQFATASALTLGPSLMTEQAGPDQIIAAWSELLVLGLFATAVAFCIQTVAQKYTTTSRAALLVSGESIFGALGAFLWLGERPAFTVLVGATLIFISIVAVAVLPSSTDKLFQKAGDLV
jgi:drug/metabolite transporter (DMT)-like permease